MQNNINIIINISFNSKAAPRLGRPAAPIRHPMVWTVAGMSAKWRGQHYTVCLPAPIEAMEQARRESHGVTITLMLISMLCGTLLGLRYKIFVLVPATALIGLAVSTTEAAAGQSTTHIFFATILSAIGLQTGYLWQAFRSIAARSRGTRRASKVGLVL
jgi:hypothetical protein